VLVGGPLWVVFVPQTALHEPLGGTLVEPWPFGSAVVDVGVAFHGGFDAAQLVFDVILWIETKGIKKKSRPSLGLAHILQVSLQFHVQEVQ
jgi:hypothetical protein